AGDDIWRSGSNNEFIKEHQGVLEQVFTLPENVFPERKPSSPALLPLKKGEGSKAKPVFIICVQIKRYLYRTVLCFTWSVLPIGLNENVLRL
ncbi:hypothetical protein, partial [Legionella bononiensis]|uniref:hypothetical protein n=1 Tax=Legionella bononiensis TaxID=2793102 RepID=UPI001EE3BB3F